MVQTYISNISCAMKIKVQTQVCKVFPDSHFGSFYSQNLVPHPQKREARVLSDAHMICPKLYLFHLSIKWYIDDMMYFWFKRQELSIYFGSSLQKSLNHNQGPLYSTLGSPWDPRFKALRENPGYLCIGSVVLRFDLVRDTLAPLHAFQGDISIFRGHT